MVIRLPEFSVRFKTSNQFEGAWNIITEVNLEKVKVKLKDIKSIETFFEVPGVLYTEPGVARETHPCGGSIGFWINTYDNKRASIQDILYYDPNIRQTHHNGLPHWNHERRFINIEGKEDRTKENIEYHIINDSDEITIYFNGKKKTIKKKLKKL